MTGLGSIIKAGANLQTLSGTNSYSGGTTVNAGGLAFEVAGSIPATGTLTVNAGGAVGGMRNPAGLALGSASCTRALAHSMANPSSMALSFRVVRIGPRYFEAAASA